MAYAAIQVRGCRVDIRPRFTIFLGLVVLAAAAQPLNAQAGAVAQVTGSVVDSTGAAIAGAQVTMTETDKQLSRSAVTDAGGSYVLPNLPVGPYSLEIRANDRQQIPPSARISSEVAKVF